MSNMRFDELYNDYTVAKTILELPNIEILNRHSKFYILLKQAIIIIIASSGIVHATEIIKITKRDIYNDYTSQLSTA